MSGSVWKTNKNSKHLFFLSTQNRLISIISLPPRALSHSQFNFPPHHCARPAATTTDHRKPTDFHHYSEPPLPVFLSHQVSLLFPPLSQHQHYDFRVWMNLYPFLVDLLPRGLRCIIIFCWLLLNLLNFCTNFFYVNSCSTSLFV